MIISGYVNKLPLSCTIISKECGCSIIKYGESLGHCLFYNEYRYCHSHTNDHKDARVKRKLKKVLNK